MAIKNTNLGGTDWSDGESTIHTDLNDTFDEAFEQYMTLHQKWQWYFNVTGY